MQKKVLKIIHKLYNIKRHNKSQSTSLCEWERMKEERSTKKIKNVKIKAIKKHPESHETANAETLNF